MILKLGSIGKDVLNLQQSLNKLGAGLAEDGDFGPRTLAAVKAFQKKYTLKVDGIVGPITQQTLAHALDNGTVIDPPPPGFLLGIDIYNGDAVSSFQKVKDAGYKFIFHKASEGTTFVDKSFKARRAQALSLGFFVGAYHYFHPNMSAKAQAEHFLKQVGKLGENELPLTLDWEETDGVSNAQANKVASECLHILEQESGMVPIIYGSTGQLAEYNIDSALKRHPLWVAHLVSGAPRIPSPWSDYTFHQYSFTGKVPGIGNDCDLDKFRGNTDTMKQFIEKSKV